jgi:hypothetical protein
MVTEEKSTWMKDSPFWGKLTYHKGKNKPWWCPFWPVTSPMCTRQTRGVTAASLFQWGASMPLVQFPSTFLSTHATPEQMTTQNWNKCQHICFFGCFMVHALHSVKEETMNHELRNVQKEAVMVCFKKLWWHMPKDHQHV